MPVYLGAVDEFPSKGKTIKANELDYDTVLYFKRMNKNLVVTLKNGKKVKASAGTFYDDLVFSGQFPEDIKHRNWKEQSKYFRNVKVVS